MSLAIRRLVIAGFCAAALAAVGRADGSGTAASPVAFPRSGALHVTKDCPPSTYAGQAGDFCTISSSNLDAIETGSRVIYARAADFKTLTLDSDVVLDLPGPGNNAAFGHCHLNLSTGIGLCTFSGGTGQFTQFHASANVSSRGGNSFAWDGTYSLDPRD